MTFFQQYGKELVSLFVPFLTWFLNVKMRARVRLVWASPHQFDFLAQNPNPPQGGNPHLLVRTASIRVINFGRETATNVEIVVNYKPDCVNFWPVRHYEEKTAEGRYIVVFDSLSPKEEITMEMLIVTREMPKILVVRSDQCVADRIALRWFEAVPQWKIRVAQIGMLVGLGTAIYWFIVLVQFLVLKTPQP